MSRKASGKAEHTCIDVAEQSRRFPYDVTAQAWILERRWPLPGARA